MNVTCPECRSVFRVDPTKVPASGVRARCAVCGAVMGVQPPAAAPAPEAPARGTPRTTAAFAWPRATPAAVPAADSPPAPAASTATAVAGATPTTPAALTPAFGAPTRPTGGGPAVGALAHPGGGTPAFGTRRSGGTGRSINPFLSNDPDQKAKRLARALVSDIVAYHPQLRDQGLREGTLKQLFRDEIKKSYEEYVEQVGKQFAESTAHFQDALNDILAAGRKLF